MKNRCVFKFLITAIMFALLVGLLAISASAASVEAASGAEFEAAMEQAKNGEIDTIILINDITSTVTKFYPAASRNVIIKSSDGANYTISSTNQLEIGITSGAYQYNKDLRANVTFQNVTFDLNNSQRAFYVSADGGVLNLDGVTIQNGKRSNNNGGAMAVFGEANLTNVTISNCSVESLVPTFYCYGGAIYVEGGKLTLTGGNISNCRTAGGTYNNGGAIYAKNSELTVNGVTISNNTAVWQGGGVFAIDSTVTMNSGNISSNTATGHMGGGVALYSTDFVMNGGSISKNTAHQTGGNVMLAKGSTFDYYYIKGARVSNGTLSASGGWSYSKDFILQNETLNDTTLNVYIKTLTEGNMTLDTSNAPWVHNRATSSYTGNYNLIYTVDSNISLSSTWNISTPAPKNYNQYTDYTLPLYNYIIRGSNDAVISASGQNFSANQLISSTKDMVAVTSGSAILFESITFDAKNTTNLRPLYIASGANVTLAADTLVKGGNANEKGGGVLVNGATLTLNGGAVNYNTGTYGGGVCLTNDATMTINGGELAGNTATERGGAIYLESPSSTVAASRLTINNGNIYSNCAQTRYGQGGAIYIAPSSVSTKGNTVDMYGGKIYENLSRGQGVVAVRLYGVFNMYGGEIYSNSRGLVNEDKSMTANDDRGSGVYVNGGTFKMAKSDLSSSIPTIRDNTGWHGSAIDIENGTVDLSHGLITNNINRLGNGNTTYYGAIFAQAGTLNIGGDISIYGNQAPTRNQEENIFVYSANMTLKVASNLTGKVGIYSKTNTTNTKVATCQSGVTSIGGLFVDNSTKSLSIDGTNVVITDNTPYFITALHSGNVLKLTSGNTLTVDYSSLSSIQGTYTDADFLGIVDVSGFGTDSVQANALYKAGDTISNITGELYAVWVKVDTIPMASAMINASSSSNAASGLKFITTVQTSQLDSIGLFAKSPSTDGDGYIRGTLLGIVGKTDLVFGGNYASDSPINNTGWLSAEKYKGYVGNDLPEGYSAYTTVLTYSNPENYNKAVSFRGYITVEVNGVSSTVYSYFNPPSVLENGDDVTYTTVHHARSARAVVRGLYFKGSETKAKTSLGSNYSKALEIAGYVWDGYNTDWVNSSEIIATNYSYQPTFNLFKNTSVYGKNLSTALQNVDKSGSVISGSIGYTSNYSGYTNALSASEKDISIAQYANGKYGYGYFLTFELYAPVSDYSNATIELLYGTDRRTISGTSMSNQRVNVAFRIDPNSDYIVVRCDWDGAGSTYEPCISVLDLTGLTFQNRSGVDAICELAFAYDRRGEWIQYETYSISRTAGGDGGHNQNIDRTNNLRISPSAIPEEANSTSILYLDCAGFINAVYVNSINSSYGEKESIEIVDDENTRMFFYALTHNEDEIEAAEILADFEAILQPGDLIAYAYTNKNGGNPVDGHTMIYLGNGMMAHCEGEVFIDGSYHKSGDVDKIGHPFDTEEINGAITIESIYDTLLNKDHHRYLFSGQTKKDKFAILRPLDLDGSATTANAQKRLNHLTGVVIETVCSHPYGKTVATGEVITMTYNIANTSSSYKGFTVEFLIPSGTTPVNGTPVVTYSSGNQYAAQAVQLQAGETKTISFSIRVNDNTAEGTKINIKTLAANLSLNTCVVTVGNGLSNVSLNEISSLLSSANTLTATSDFTLMQAFYSKIGASLNLGGAQTIYALLDDIFTYNTGTGFAYMATSSNNAGQKMLAPGLYGGYRLNTTGAIHNARIKKLTTDALMPGDIIVFSGDPFSNISDLPNECNLYIYLGNDTFITYDGGVKTFTANGKDRIAHYTGYSAKYLDDELAQLFGCGVFAVLRPSLY
ncbi:MAG: hypothetical protein IJF14_01160 [Clostridia bacterium]|nr:hypothetical protein [Clostridia bacterium]